jgi:hypothetical protein
MPIDRRINKTGAGDDDLMRIEPIEADCLRGQWNFRVAEAFI